MVPGSNLLPLVMAAGPSGIQLDFSFQHRGTTSTLGRTPPPHVVPGSNLLPLVMAGGPSGIQLDFSYQHRGTTSTLGRIPA